MSWYELARRTAIKTWQDHVFGQAARLAFYHFLALFPALLLLLLLLSKLPVAGTQLCDTLTRCFQELMPPQSSSLVSATIGQLKGTASLGKDAISAVLTGAWAAVNGTWAIIAGLNTAYEVNERRPWWKLTAVALALTLSLAVAGLLSLILLFYGARLGQFTAEHFGWSMAVEIAWPFVQWPVVIVLLLACFALLYRFAPNMHDRRMQWSTPGAIIALLLWIASALLMRTYFRHFHFYETKYGQLNSVAILLLWFYFTGASLLIGGELNSEIEKAAKHEDGSGDNADKRSGT